MGETGDMALRLLPAVATVISPIILIRCLMAICNEKRGGQREIKKKTQKRASEPIEAGT